MPQTLWEIKPVIRVIRFPNVEPIRVPVYPSLLVPEAEYAQQLQEEKVSNAEFMNKMVAFCLKHRGVLAPEIPDDKIIANTRGPIAEALFCLFYHGPTGKPEDPMSYVYNEEELGNEGSPPTGGTSSGAYSDGIQTANTLPLADIATVPQSLPSTQPKPTAVPA